MPKPTKKSSGEASSIKDTRFSNFETDPRFQLPSKKNVKTKLDKRFARVLNDDEFTATAKVDRYGRKIKTDSKKKALERLYENEEDESGSGSGSEDDEEVEDVEVERDDIVRRELEKADQKYDPARDGGFSSSEDDSDSDDSEEEEEPEVDDGEEESRPGIRLRREKEEVPEGEITNRFAVVNFDWDHIKSVDLMALFSSFVPPGGRIEKVSIYPSEFGKERMQREEMEGPPKEIFKKGKGEDSDEEDEESEGFSDEEDEDSDEEVKKELLADGDDQDFDSDKLRTYQLDRLRYYYAVAVCSDKNTAHKIYEATDGSEYLSSSNFLDLRFIPDDTTFDDEPRDECTVVPPGYKPVDFVTDALQHSKVKLTWDMHPEEANRKESIKKAFSGSKNDIAENDLRAYLASDSSDDEEDFEEEEPEAPAEAEAEEEAEKPLSKKELARRKMRAALGLPEEPIAKKSKSAVPAGEMEITFTPALSESNNKKPEAEETTIEKYKRRERERKEAKRQKMLARRKGLDPDAAMGESDVEEVAAAGGDNNDGEDLGFDDPFFTSEPIEKSKSAIRKEERLKKRAEKEQADAESAAAKAQLELLMADEKGEGDHLDHFDMREVMKAEKQKGKKGKKGKGKRGGQEEEKDGLQDGFKMDVDDERFRAVFESHEFAIDPSNPKFKATEGMNKLLEEGRKKRKAGGDEPRGNEKVKKVKASMKRGDDEAGELSSLVEAVKRKAKAGRK
ncbi:putative Pre-rRNA-processing protein ESF1 [Triangularia verruculosa]|uniref:Pre-rRNA-processing protein ESF1 n=1 Tax=Triangularia verruculosa TaxID=2587418 RepID=A0AAN6XAS9_9PEZI|nr:putative Pre-rRNA-processing protein ESF1 [Triangularia verruculosa]